MGRLLGGIGNHGRFRGIIDPILGIGLTPIGVEQRFDTAFSLGGLIAVKRIA